LDAERDAFVVHACGLACGEGARAVNVDAGVRSVHVDDLLLPRGGVIRGRVLDVRGKGIEYLRVESWARQGPVWETAIQGHVISAGFRRVMTDADGRFELAGLRTCMHRIVLQLEGRTARWDATERDGVLPDGEELVFRQLPDGVLRGRVVDAETNAPLTVFTVDDERHEDAGGSFEVPFALFEPVFVEAEGHGGNLWWRAPDELHMETVEHVFALERQRPVAEPPSARLTVRAIDERGVPVKGVRLRRIWGKRPDLGLIEEALGELVPDSRGDGEALLVPRVALGREVGIDAPGHAFTREALDRRRDEDQTLELVLERGASVAVRLRDELGLVARDVQFELDSAKRKEREFLSWSDGNTVRLGRTDSAEPFSVTAGELRIEGLPAGRYTLIARFGEDRNASFEFEVHAEEPRSYDFQFTPR
ncbi:MAG: hypothetical protein HZA53_00330, partial [Planctomycetes bacterium]|nr:hypothetical protein [Planctomycetota bacterium]